MVFINFSRIKKNLKLINFRKNTFQELLFCVPASPQPPSERGGEIQGQKPRSVAHRTTILKSGVFVFLKKGEEPNLFDK
jgi:hypothetical protein